jgi:DNA polymerase (family 10)
MIEMNEVGYSNHQFTELFQTIGDLLEINAHPSRLDLDDIYARRAIELGVLLSINTDAH